MKTKIITHIFATLFICSIVSNAQNTGTGINWETSQIQPGSPILVDENFQGFEFFHTDADPDSGNSENTLDEDGETIIWGYKDLEVDVPIIGNDDKSVHYSFTQCAFAPDWMTAYAHKDMQSSGSGSNSPFVSDGFVEVSREYPSAVPTLQGYFTVDLTNIAFVEIIQWSHSSTGGNKRGVLCEFSLDNGTTWDTLRYQPGNAYGASFTTDPFTGDKTPNNYRCDPSAYGISWIDELYIENLMLRFSEAGGQTPRIHDLKVYGDMPVSVNEIDSESIKVITRNKEIVLSQVANVQVYNLSGAKVIDVSNTNRILMGNYPAGVYFVKTVSGNKIQTTKLLIK